MRKVWLLSLVLLFWAGFASAFLDTQFFIIEDGNGTFDTNGITIQDFNSWFDGNWILQFNQHKGEFTDTNIWTASADSNAWWLQNFNLQDLNVDINGLFYPVDNSVSIWKLGTPLADINSESKMKAVVKNPFDSNQGGDFEVQGLDVNAGAFLGMYRSGGVFRGNNEYMSGYFWNTGRGNPAEVYIASSDDGNNTYGIAMDVPFGNGLLIRRSNINYFGVNVLEDGNVDFTSGGSDNYLTWKQNVNFTGNFLNTKAKATIGLDTTLGARLGIVDLGCGTAIQQQEYGTGAKELVSSGCPTNQDFNFSVGDLSHVNTGSFFNFDENSRLFKISDANLFVTSDSNSTRFCFNDGSGCLATLPSSGISEADGNKIWVTLTTDQNTTGDKNWKGIQTFYEPTGVGLTNVEVYNSSGVAPAVKILSPFGLELYSPQDGNIYATFTSSGTNFNTAGYFADVLVLGNGMILNPNGNVSKIDFNAGNANAVLLYNSLVDSFRFSDSSGTNGSIVGVGDLELIKNGVDNPRVYVNPIYGKDLNIGASNSSKNINFENCTRWFDGNLICGVQDILNVIPASSGISESDANGLYVRLNPDGNDQNITSGNLMIKQSLLLANDTNLGLNKINGTYTVPSVLKATFNSETSNDGEAAYFDNNTSIFNTGAAFGGYRGSGFFSGNADYFGGYFWNHTYLGNSEVIIAGQGLNSNQVAPLFVQADYNGSQPQVKIQYDFSNGFNTQVTLEGKTINTIYGSVYKDYSLKPNVSSDINVNFGSTDSGHYNTRLTLNGAWAGTPTQWLTERTGSGEWTTSTSLYNIHSDNWDINSDGNTNFEGIEHYFGSLGNITNNYYATDSTPYIQNKFLMYNNSPAQGIGINFNGTFFPQYYLSATDFNILNANLVQYNSNANNLMAGSLSVGSRTDLTYDLGVKASGTNIFGVIDQNTNQLAFIGSSGGNPDVRLGDVDSAYNSTSVFIDDSTNTITLNGKVLTANLPPNKYVKTNPSSILTTVDKISYKDLNDYQSLDYNIGSKYIPYVDANKDINFNFQNLYLINDENNQDNLHNMASSIDELRSNTLLDDSRSSLSASGGVLTFTLTALNGRGEWDFNGKVYGGTGVAVPSASVNLTCGTDVAPVTNYIYYDLNADNVPVLLHSTTYPTSANRIDVGTFIIGACSGSSWTAYSYSRNRYEVESFIMKSLHRIEYSGTLYVDGLQPTVNATDIGIAKGGEFFNNLTEMTTNNDVNRAGGFYFIRSDGNFIQSTSLSDLNQYSDGSSIGTNYVNIVWGVVPTTTTSNGNSPTTVRLIAILQSKPATVYNTIADARADTYEATNYFPPNNEVKKAFVPVARTIIQNGAFQQIVTGVYYKDLRGRIMSGGSASSGVDLSAYSTTVQDWNQDYYFIQNTFDGNFGRKAADLNSLFLKAADFNSQYVDRFNNQTIAGIKTFTNTGSAINLNNNGDLNASKGDFNLLEITTPIIGVLTAGQVRLRAGFDNNASGGTGISAIDHSGSHSDGLGLFGHDGVSVWTGQQRRLYVDSSGGFKIGQNNGALSNGIVFSKGDSSNNVIMEFENTTGTAKGFMGVIGTAGNYISQGAVGDMILRGQSTLWLGSGSAGNAQVKITTTDVNIIPDLETTADTNLGDEVSDVIKINGTVQGSVVTYQQGLGASGGTAFNWAGLSLGSGRGVYFSNVGVKGEYMPYAGSVLWLACDANLQVISSTYQAEFNLKKNYGTIPLLVAKTPASAVGEQPALTTAVRNTKTFVAGDRLVVDINTSGASITGTDVTCNFGVQFNNA